MLCQCEPEICVLVRECDQLTKVKALLSSNVSTTVAKRAFLCMNKKEICWHFFVCGKLFFVRMCAVLTMTMNYGLLIAICDHMKHLKSWPVQLKIQSECTWVMTMPSW